jgi:hypothetical protein
MFLQAVQSADKLQITNTNYKVSDDWDLWLAASAATFGVLRNLGFSS